MLDTTNGGHHEMRLMGTSCLSDYISSNVYASRDFPERHKNGNIGIKGLREWG